MPADDVPAVAEGIGAELIVLVWSQTLARGQARVVTRTLASTRIPVPLPPAGPSVDGGAASVHRRMADGSLARMRSGTNNG